MRSALAALAAAALAAATPARAFVRTTAERTGKPLAWRFPVVPWHVNRDWPATSPSCRPTPAGDPTLDALRASFAQWEQPCANLELPYAGEVPELHTGDGGSYENVVVFRRGWCSQHDQAKLDPCMSDPDVDCGGIYGCFEDSTDCIGQTSCPLDWGIVALTSVLYDPSSGRILDADIELNGWDGVAGNIGSPPQHGWYFTCYPGAGTAQPQATCNRYGEPTAGQPDCASMDLQNTVTHEVGHFVGLRHPCTTDRNREPDLPSCGAGVPAGAVPFADRTMSPTTDVLETKKRHLSPDDLAGLCAIYPEPGGCGCGGGQGAGAVSLLAVLLALRPRRRR